MSTDHFSKILFNWGSILDNIQFEYGGVLGPRRGSTGGNPASCDINSGDYIVKARILVIEGYGPMTRGLHFTTKNGLNCTMGIQEAIPGNSVFETSAPDGYHLAYLSGRYGQRYSNPVFLRFHWKKCD